MPWPISPIILHSCEDAFFIAYDLNEKKLNLPTYDPGISEPLKFIRSLRHSYMWKETMYLNSSDHNYEC